MTDTFSPYAGRLQALQKEFTSKSLNGFLVPMEDAYLNEYVPPSDRRIEFLSGFTGSAALMIVLEDKVLFFTDSRYTLQASKEVPEDLCNQFDVEKQDPVKWLIDNIKEDIIIGFDPQLHCTHQIESMRKKLESSTINLRATDKNFIDEIWTSRPPVISEPIIAHEQRYTGKSSFDKRTEIALQLKKQKLDATLITDPASVAWLFNIRGSDIPYTPLPLSRAILYNDGRADWFVDTSKPTSGLHLTMGSNVTTYKLEEFLPTIKKLSEDKNNILLDPRQTPYIYTDCILKSAGKIKRGEDLCALPRACKNKTEIDGIQSAHRRDGAALVKLLAWVDKNMGQPPIKELDVVNQLETFRSEGSNHKGPSFTTISASGPNGAIVHYQPTEELNRQIDRDSFLLLDSGAQYLDGTTDVTRTIPTGKLTTEMMDRYTRVLKGHIALASICFPEGTSGAALDVLARQYLWQIGEDYGHGTGHGVGSYLNVHEGPQAISRNSPTALKVGMVISNEPGFYKAQHYGIRHENLQYVTELYDLSTPEQKIFGFSPLTLAPFDRRAILVDMLTEQEKIWLNAYHVRITKALMPQLDKSTSAWLEKMTKPI